MGDAPAKPLPRIAAREWTEGHKVGWDGFLRTDVGVTLMERMRCVAAANAQAGAADAMHTAHSAGRATGFYDAIHWLESQARIEFEQVSGADADQSATSGQPLHGEAALLEHYSP